MRIDVIEVYEKAENKYYINHIKNAMEKQKISLWKMCKKTKIIERKC